MIRLRRRHWRRSRSWCRAGAAALLCASLACSGAQSDATPGEREAVQPPTRVVALVPSLSELALAIGAGDVLVARTDYDTHPDLISLPSVGGGLDPSLEAMVALDIDLVIVPQSRDAPELAARLHDLGIGVIAVRTQSIEDVYESIDVMGEAFGRPEEARALSESIESELAEVRASVEGAPRVSAMYVVWPDPPMTAAGGTFVDQLIEIAGGRNVFADSPIEWPTVGFEAIVRRNPEVVIWPEGEVVRDPETLRVTAGWREVEAIQAGRIVRVDANLFNRPGPQIGRAARELARALHPDR